MNWVDKRARTAELLDSAIPRLFDYLCIALEQSTASYNRHFRTGDDNKVTFKRQENTVHIGWSHNTRIGGTQAARQISLVDRNVTCTTTGKDKPEFTLHYAANCDDGTVCLTRGSGALISDDEATRLMLEELFFPPKSARSRPSTDRSLWA